MKAKSILFLLTYSLSTNAQNLTKEDFEKVIKPLNDKVIMLQLENGRFKNGIKTLNSKLTLTAYRLDSLQKQTEANMIANKMRN